MPELERHPMADAESQLRVGRARADQLLFVRKHYIVVGASQSVLAFLDEEPSLISLLIEAVQPLHQAFGKGRVLQMRTQFSDEDGLLKVSVQLPSDFEADPELALRSFDLVWWLANCHRSGGALVFDYEIQDAV